MGVIYFLIKKALITNCCTRSTEAGPSKVGIMNPQPLSGHQVGCLLDQAPPSPDSVCHVALTHNIESSLHRCGGTAGSVGGTATVQTPVLHPSHLYGNGADIQVPPTGCGSGVRLSDWPRPHHRGGNRAADSAGQDGLLADAHHRSIQLRDNWWVHWKRGMEGGREGGKLGMEMFAVVKFYCYGC